MILSIQVCSKYWTGNTYSKELFTVYLKFKFTWVPSISSGKPILTLIYVIWDFFFLPELPKQLKETFAFVEYMLFYFLFKLS